MTNSDIVQKLWNLCDVLRDDGINYSDYVTELVLLLFIKMEYEQVQNNDDFAHKLPEGARWPDLAGKSGLNLLNHYRQMLLDLGQNSDPLIAAIYADAQTRLKEPRHLEQLIRSLDGIDWFSAREDGLGDLYEGLLEKNASETKSGAGQYFTPRPLIDSIIRAIRPQPGETIQDPAAGTAGFLIAADAWIKQQTDDFYDLDDKARRFQRNQAYVGIELVPGTRRLALMNCLLHGMEGDAEGVVHLGNALGQVGAALPKVDVILSNPPFGTARGGGGPTRDDLTYRTSNKQLAFLQHIYRGLKPGGRAAVVLPDNVLFEAGVGTEVRRDLLDKCNLHTILRLPTGIFYAQGVKTNVLFFQKGSQDDPRQEEGCTKRVWIFDLRSNMPSFGKRTPFGAAHLKAFEEAYGEDPNGNSPRAENVEGIGELSRFRCFTRKEIAERGDSLDISWLKDEGSIDAADLPAPEVLAGEAMAELTEALRELDALMQALGARDEAERCSTPGADSNWSKIAIGSLCNAAFDGPFGSKLKSDDYTSEGVRVVRLENIGHLSFIDEKKTFISSEKFEDLSKNKLEAGDILFSSFVDEEIRVCRFPESEEVFINKADCFCLRINQETANPVFVMHALAARRTYRQIREAVHGATRPRINLGFLKSFEISLPSLEEQTEIVRRIEQLFALAGQLEARVKAAQARIDRLTQSILAKAFRGELVPQDPDDEPASELLARIQAQRASAPKAKRGRNKAENA